MEALRWTYEHLDVPVQRCFSYCSIFPRGHHFYSDELINLWVAEGFIDSYGGKYELEAVGQLYLDKLVSYSFLQKENLRGSFTVPDLVHFLAVEVAGSECLSIQNGWEGDLPQNVHHLFIEIDGGNISEEILELTELRTLIINHTGQNWQNLSYEIFQNVFMNLPRLRVLILEVEWFQSEMKIFDVPLSINLLRHLRYFGFRVSVTGSSLWVLNLPATFARLYHLLVLDVTGFDKLSFPLNEDMSGLTELRHVIIDSKDPHFPHIGRHESLRTFKHFTVKMEAGYELNQLKRLNKLRGELNIYGLENVPGNDDALQPELHKKENLTSVKLSWGNPQEDQGLQSQVLEALRPPAWLQTLQIVCYNGLAYPNWMMTNGPEAPKCLQDLKLEECRQLGEEIPEHNRLFKYLRILHVANCIWEFFPANMERLESLQKLKIEDCPNLQSLPTRLPQSLRILHISNCDRWNHWPDNMEDHMSLLELEIAECRNIESLPAQLPGSLEKLNVLAGCPEISSLPVMPHELLELILSSRNQEFITSCKTPGHQHYENISHVPHKIIEYGKALNPLLLLRTNIPLLVNVFVMWACQQIQTRTKKWKTINEDLYPSEDGEGSVL
uniref:Putative NBS-LRR class RGA n=1 Tax=Oryza nivara TaxID=4536 RepID=A0A679BAC5_ORYNI|nr:putative NBS-LRR class RGA [Oryza sativa f. spontanea]